MPYLVKLQAAVIAEGPPQSKFDIDPVWVPAVHGRKISWSAGKTAFGGLFHTLVTVDATSPEEAFGIAIDSRPDFFPPAGWQITKSVFQNVPGQPAVEVDASPWVEAAERAGAVIQKGLDGLYRYRDAADGPNGQESEPFGREEAAAMAFCSKNLITVDFDEALNPRQAPSPAPAF